MILNQLPVVLVEGVLLICVCFRFLAPSLFLELFDRRLLANEAILRRETLLPLRFLIRLRGGDVCSD